MNKQNSDQILRMFLLCNFVLWSFVPLLRSSLPMDTMEAVVWGKYSWLGTTKHPPLSGILAYLMYCLFAKAEISMYILSQICVVLGVVYIYKLALKLLPVQAALPAALLQFGVIYYHFSSVEFNVNVISLTLWPMCAYYFWSAYTENRIKDWILFGICAGLNVLNKYVCALQFASIALFVLADKSVFKLLKNYKVYVAVFLGLAVATPHFYWLYENNFVTLDYFASRSSGGKMSGIWRHLVYPLKFIVAQVMFCAAGWITYWLFYAKNKSNSVKKWGMLLKDMDQAKHSSERSITLFVLISALAPMLLFALMSAVSGNVLKSMWGFPCLYMFGIALAYFLPMKLNKKRCRLFVLVMLSWSVLFAIGYSAQCLLTTSPRFTSDCMRIVRDLEQKWQQKVPDKTLKYVGGSEWFVEKHGALLVTEDVGAYQKMGENYTISAPQKLTLQYKNYFGKTKDKDLYYGFYLPKEDSNVR